MKPTILYQATNKENGKRYIGITSTSISVRRSSHFCEARRGSRTRFHRALLKGGADAFEWRPLAILCSPEEAAETEIRAIAVLKPEYNLHAGGSLGAAGLPKSIRMKMNSHKKKKVRCLTTGAIFDSCVAAAKANGVHPTEVGECCRGRNTHAHGIKFVFERDYISGNYDPDRKKKLDAKRRAVRCLDSGIIYASVCDAAKAYKTTTANIRMVCQGKRRIAGGARFQYEGIPVDSDKIAVRAKLNAEQVLEIRRLIETRTFSEIADRFSVSTGTISDIKRRRSWKDLP